MNDLVINIMRTKMPMITFTVKVNRISKSTHHPTNKKPHEYVGGL
tara:strand:+ start:60 stop:194 length:135 start_codon:yes stop_codon:yes gene_type:complete